MRIRELIKRYKNDEAFRNKVNLYNGSITSMVFVAIQLYGGIRYLSLWFFSFAIYNAVLAVVRFYLARSIGKKRAEGWMVFRVVGFVMAILNIALIV